MTLYLTAPNAQKTQHRTYRWKVQLASNQLELDRYGEPVPQDYKIIDVVVLSPGEAPIRQLIATTSWLNGFSIVGIWEPEDCCEAF